MMQFIYFFNTKLYSDRLRLKLLNYTAPVLDKANVLLQGIFLFKGTIMLTALVFVTEGLENIIYKKQKDYFHGNMFSCFHCKIN